MHRTDSAALTLGHDEAEAPVVYRFDRRQHDRWPDAGHATAIRIAGERFGENYDLRLLDSSHEGIGVMCGAPIEPGAVISLGFASPGRPARRGVVMRCRPSGAGYRIGIRFEQRLMAA